MSDEAIYIDNAIQGHQYIAFEWSMVAVTFLLLVNRLYVRVYLRGLIWSIRSWRWSEFLIILSWLLFLGTVIIDSLLNDMGNWDPNWMPADIADISRLAKLFFVQQFTNFPSIYCAKGALLCFYNELTPPQTHRKTWWAIRVIGVLVAVGAVEMVLHAPLSCYPHVTYAFDGSLSTLEEIFAIDDLCAARNRVQNLTMYAFHIGTDVLVFVLPCFILHFALAGRSFLTKLAVYGMFAVGFLNLVCAVGTFALVENLQTAGDSNTTRYWVLWQSQNMMGMIQSATAVLIPCLAQLRFTYNQMTSGKSSEIQHTGGSSDVEKGFLSRFRSASRSSGSSSDQRSRGSVAKEAVAVSVVQDGEKDKDSRKVSV